MNETLTKEEQAELDGLNSTGLTIAEQAELDELNGVKKKSSSEPTSTSSNAPVSPSIESLPPITLSEESLQQGQAKQDVLQPIKEQVDVETYLPKIQRLRTKQMQSQMAVKDAEKSGDIATASKSLDELAKTKEEADKLSDEYAQSLGYDGAKLGYFDTFLNSAAHTIESMDFGVRYMHSTPENQAKMLKERYDKRQLENVLQPKEGIAGDITGALGGLSPFVGAGMVTGGAGLLPALVAGAATFGLSEIGAKADEGYAKAKEQGLADEEAAKIGHTDAAIGGGTGVLAGGILHGIGSKEIPKSFTDWLGGVAKKNAAIGGVFGAMQLTQNVANKAHGLDVPLTENVAKSAATGAAIGVLMEALHKIPEMGIEAKNKIKDVIAYTNPQAAIVGVNKAVEVGELTPVEGNELVSGIAEKAEVFKQLPDVPFEEAVEVAPLQKEIMDLKKQGERSETAKELVKQPIEEKTAELKEKLGHPLDSKEAKRLEDLNSIAKDAEDKLTATEIKERNHLRKRKTAYENKLEKQGKEEANKIAKDLGFKGATHLLRKANKMGLGEFETVQEIPKDILDKITPDGENLETSDGAGEVTPSTSETPVTETAPVAEVKPVEQVENVLAKQLNVSNEEANVLSMLHDSKILTPIEKATLYKQYKNGVMNEADINKYTAVDVKDIQTDNVNKWGKVILDKTKGRKIEAEDIVFEETKPTEVAPKEDYQVTTEDVEMPDGEKGKKVTITKPNGEKVELGEMYPEDVEKETAKKIRGFKLSETKPTEEVIAETPKQDWTGKEVSFTHAGSDKVGKVQSIDKEGNLKVKDSKGTNYTVKPQDAMEASSTQKFYENIAGSQPSNQTGRIPVEPIIGGKPKNIRDIIFDVTKSTKQRLFFSKPSSRRGSLGTYSPGNSAVKIKFNGDLDVTAHELGHSIDDHFGILSDLQTTPNLPVEQELAKFSPFGSKPPTGHPNPRLYEYGEGFAEYLRARIVNPDAAKAEAPELTRLYESKVSAEYKKAVDDFSTDVRTWAGSSGRDITLSNIEVEPKKETLMGKILDSNGNNEFVISWVDKLAANFTNPLTAFNKAFEYAKDIKGAEVLPSDDPRILARLLLGIDGKYGEILQHGMIDGENKLLKDANGDAKNLDWLLKPLDNTDQSTIKRDAEDVMAYMVSERTVELSKKFGRENVLSGVGGGVFKDVDIAQKTLNEFNNGDPNRLARIQEAANRYREFSDDILKYMVEKGRMSKENYDQIKADNLQYVAMMRVMETEPNREIENSFGKGGKLGNKSEPIKKITGSTKTIQNPYISLINTLHKAVTEADRNDVLRSFRDMLVEDRNMYEGQPKRFSDVGAIGKQGDKNAITIFVDGKPEHWLFQEDVYRALKGLDGEAYKLPAIATALPRLLRWTVTNFPTFAARNVVRDFQDRIIKSNDNSGFRDLFGDKEHWRELARSGGLNAGYYMRDKASYYGLLEEAMHDMAKNKKMILADPIKLRETWDGYKNILTKSETINRVAEYRAAFKNAKSKGMDDYNASIYAGYKSRDLMDFALAGHYMKVINQIIPFSNAAIQGTRKAVTSAKENPVGFATRMAAYTVAPNIALWLLNHRDKETAEEYEAMPAYQRDMAWNIKLGSNMWLSVPKPFELSLGGAGIDRALSKYVYGNEDAFDGYGGSVAKSTLPVDEANIVPIAPALAEAKMNYDLFRDKNIVPPSENNVDLSLRNTERASRIGKFIQDKSVAIGDILQKDIGMDARKIDHVIKGQTSYFGNAALKTSNIGRKDGEHFGLSDLGFFKETPAYNSTPVQNFIKYAEKWQLGRDGAMKEFHRLASDYFDETDDDKKDDKAKVLRDYARQQVKDWKASNIEERKKLKAEKKKNK